MLATEGEENSDEHPASPSFRTVPRKPILIKTERKHREKRYI
jgi:hypothetical protein